MPPKHKQRGSIPAHINSEEPERKFEKFEKLMDPPITQEEIRCLETQSAPIISPDVHLLISAITVVILAVLCYHLIFVGPNPNRFNKDLETTCPEKEKLLSGTLKDDTVKLFVEEIRKVYGTSKEFSSALEMLKSAYNSDLVKRIENMNAKIEKLENETDMQSVQKHIETLESHVYDGVHVDVKKQLAYLSGNVKTFNEDLKAVATNLSVKVEKREKDVDKKFKNVNEDLDRVRVDLEKDMADFSGKVDVGINGANTQAKTAITMATANKGNITDLKAVTTDLSVKVNNYEQDTDQKFKTVNEDLNSVSSNLNVKVDKHGKDVEMKFKTVNEDLDCVRVDLEKQCAERFGKIELSIRDANTKAEGASAMATVNKGNISDLKAVASNLNVKVDKHEKNTDQKFKTVNEDLKSVTSNLNVKVDKHEKDADKKFKTVNEDLKTVASNLNVKVEKHEKGADKKFKTVNEDIDRVRVDLEKEMADISEKVEVAIKGANTQAKAAITMATVNKGNISDLKAVASDRSVKVNNHEQDTDQYFKTVNEDLKSVASHLNIKVDKHEKDVDKKLKAVNEDIKSVSANLNVKVDEHNKDAEMTFRTVNEDLRALASNLNVKVDKHEKDVEMKFKIVNEDLDRVRVDLEKQCAGRFGKIELSIGDANTKAEGASAMATVNKGNISDLKAVASNLNVKVDKHEKNTDQKFKTVNEDLKSVSANLNVKVDKHEKDAEMQFRTVNEDLRALASNLSVKVNKHEHNVDTKFKTVNEDFKTVTSNLIAKVDKQEQDTDRKFMTVNEDLIAVSSNLHVKVDKHEKDADKKLNIVNVELGQVRAALSINAKDITNHWEWAIEKQKTLESQQGHSSFRQTMNHELIDEIRSKMVLYDASFYLGLFSIGCCVVMVVISLKNKQNGRSNYMKSTSVKQANKNANIDIYQLKMKVPMENSVCVIAFSSETERQHTAEVKSLFESVGATVPVIHTRVIRRHTDIQDLPGSRIFMVFIDFNERNVILEDPNKGLGDLRVTTVRSLWKFGGDVTVIYCRDQGSRHLPDELFNRDLSSIYNQPELSQLKNQQRLLSIFEGFSDFQKKHCRDFIDRQLKKSLIIAR